MKKIMALVSALAMIGAGFSTFAGTHASALSEEEAKYDVNGDGVVDAKDPEYIIYFYATTMVVGPVVTGDRSVLKNYTIDRIGEKEYYRFDLNNDGFSDAKDATYLNMYLMDTTGKTFDELNDAIADKSYFTEEYMKPIDDLFGVKRKIVEVKKGKFSSTIIDENNTEEKEVQSLSEYKPGDSNGDGVIDAKDATLVLASYAQQIADSVNKSSYESQVSYSLNADVNGDGVVDAKDATYILVSYAKNIYNGIV